MTYDAGVARAAYLLDISQPRQAAAELRALFQGIQQTTTASPQTVLAPPTAPLQAYVASLREMATASAAANAPTQSLVDAIRAEGAALGQSEAQISAHLAALSREALAAGDVARALELEEAALGAEASQQEAGTAKTLQRTQAEARAAIAAKDYAGAIQLLTTELAGQGERSIAVINAERQLITVTNQAAAAAEREAAAEQRQADTAIRIAQQQARAALATKDYAGALEILNTAQLEHSGASATTIASLETQIAQTEAAGTATGAFASQLGGLLSPIALVTAGIGAVVEVTKSFGDALAFEGKLDESRRAFDGVIGSVSVGNAILDEAIQRGKVYGFTQSEISTAFRELSPIIRESTSSTKEQTDALARFAVLHPEDAVNQLKTAVEGLQSGGRISGIAKDLGLTADEQERLKKAVADGKDVFVALNDVLDRHGITLQTATERMQGYEGATRRAQQADEDLNKAAAAFAVGPGVAITDAKITGLQTVTAELSGRFNDLATANQAFASTLIQTGSLTDAFAARTAVLSGTANDAAIGVMRSADADDRVAAAAARAKPQIEGLTGALLAQANATALADQRKGEQTGTDLSAGEFNKFADIAAKARADKAAEDKKAADKAKQDNAALINSEIALAGAKKNTGKEIDLLRQKQAQLDRTTVAGQAEYNTIQAQIIGIEAAGGSRRVSAAQSTALQLQNVEENSGLQLARIQRENLERLADQQQDYDLKRSRSQEDEDRKIRDLFAHGQRAQAEREKADFAIKQRRDQEDFNIQRQQTLRNNAEALGDTTSRVDLRTQQIDQRAALRGVRAGGALPSGAGPLPAGASVPSGPSGNVLAVNISFAPRQIQINGHTLVEEIYTEIHERIDIDLSRELNIVIPGAGQPSVAGVRP